MPPKYKPGGKRFPPRVTSKPLPKQVINDNNETSSAATSESSPDDSGFDLEAENQLELELYWCIQQLQIILQSGTLSEKRSLETAKTLNLLRSNKVSYIRKRQAMRTTFGDYRAKMAQEEKKHGKYVSNVKFAAPKTEKKKCVFLRKINTPEQDTDKTESGEKTEEKNDDKKVFVMSKEPSDVPFKFNFSQPEEESIL